MIQASTVRRVGVSVRRFFRLGQRQFDAVRAAKVVSIQLTVYKSQFDEFVFVHLEKRNSQL
jgi:hypothetical protein